MRSARKSRYSGFVSDTRGDDGDADGMGDGWYERREMEDDDFCLCCTVVCCTGVKEMHIDASC